MDCGDFLGLRILRMTTTSLGFGRRHRTILDAFVLSAALDDMLHCRCGLSLLSDTRACEEDERGNQRKAENWLVLEHGIPPSRAARHTLKWRSGLVGPDR